MLGVRNNSDTLQTWNRVTQYFQALGIQFGGHQRQSRHVAARMRETIREASYNGIATKNVDGRYG